MRVIPSLNGDLVTMSHTLNLGQMFLHEAACSVSSIQQLNANNRE